MSAPIITLKEYREMVNDPKLDEHLDLPVVYAVDDEGNGYDRVLFSPSIAEDIDVSNDSGCEFKKAICIN